MAQTEPQALLRSQVVARVSAASILMALTLGPLLAVAEAAPQIHISGIQRLQPGWVRVYSNVSGAPSNAQYQLFVTCNPPTNANSITTTVKAGANPEFDIKVNLPWLTENGLPAPCHITHLTAEMDAGGPVAQASATVDVAMDLPLSHMSPVNTPVNATQTSISLTGPQNYAAYPPVFVVVQSSTGRTGFVEVEELPTRGTLGLRGLSAFDGTYLSFELGGGGEMQNGWGLDINGLGIWRSPELAVEITNPGHDLFPYSGSVEPALLTNNPSLDIFPAPPLFPESTYETYVLNNRGAKRCYAPTGCMDFTYGMSTHTLTAMNGAKLSLISAAPIVLGAQTNLAGPVHWAAAPRVNLRVEGSGATIRHLEPGVSKRLLKTAKKLSAMPGRDLSTIAGMQTALAASSAQTRSKAITRDRSQVVESPQELSISHLSGSSIIGHVVPIAMASCVVNGTQTGVTSTPSACSGMGTPGFACPTFSDPIKVDAITTTSGPVAALNGTIPPYYAGRDNYYGTCGSHAATQYAEALLARYSDDLAIKRVIYVNGEGIVVPEPRVAYTVSGGLAQLYIWDGTHAGIRQMIPGQHQDLRFQTSLRLIGLPGKEISRRGLRIP